MNSQSGLLVLLRAVLNLRDGESHAVREPHLPQGRIHRYRDGWHFLIDRATDRVGYQRALLGWTFRHEEHVVTFLIGDMSVKHLGNFALIGERL